MGFSSKKKTDFTLQNQKILLQILAAVEFKPSIHEHFQPRLQSRDSSKTQTNMPLWWRTGIRSIFGNKCACKLPMRQCPEFADGSKSPVTARYVHVQARKFYSCTFLWALCLVFFVCVQWNISIVVLYISLPLCMGENNGSFQEDILSHEYLTPRPYVSRTNSLVWEPPTVWFRAPSF